MSAGSVSVIAARIATSLRWSQPIAAASWADVFSVFIAWTTIKIIWTVCVVTTAVGRSYTWHIVPLWIISHVLVVSVTNVKVFEKWTESVVTVVARSHTSACARIPHVLCVPIAGSTIRVHVSRTRNVAEIVWWPRSNPRANSRTHIRFISVTDISVFVIETIIRITVTSDWSFSVSTIARISDVRSVLVAPVMVRVLVAVIGVAVTVGGFYAVVAWSRWADIAFVGVAGALIGMQRAAMIGTQNVREQDVYDEQYDDSSNARADSATHERSPGNIEPISAVFIFRHRLSAHHANYTNIHNVCRSLCS